MDPSTRKTTTGAPAHTAAEAASATEPRPDLRAVLAAPRGQRFSRPRRYARPLPPNRPERRTTLEPPAPGPAERGALPPWLSQLRTELAPEARAAAPHAGPVRTARRSSPSSRMPPARPAPARRLVAGRDRRRPRRPRRWTGPRFIGCETVPYTCTILGMLLAAYLLGLLG
ncbi:hypothetical protein [Nocardiopsis potens]|uniref:hypothetical protein n=1 Tax=Nocardiopsis potens TaxID=1246458 RepID=UPI00034D9FA2|nr:hypothetical protein [Nocardiopsis potens]